MSTVPRTGHRGEILARRSASESSDPALDVLERSARLAIQLVLFMAAYYLAARVGLGFRFQNSQIGVTWPANALLIAALLIAPRSRWWMVLSAAAVAHAVAMLPLVPAWRWSWQIAGNAALTVTTAVALQRWAGRPLHFGSRRQVLAFTGTTVALSALFAPTSPAFVRSLLHIERLYDPSSALLRVTLSSATAILFLTPAIVLWKEYGLGRLTALPARRLFEGAAIFGTLVAVVLVAFGSRPEIARDPSVLLLIIPPLMWAAVRLGPEGAATSLLCVAALSMWGSSRQLGPFVLMSDAHRVLSLQLFWIVMCPPMMLLAAVVRERDDAETALQRQRNQLAHVTRVTTVGEMSGALAHELRQPLSAILANASAAMLLLKRDPVDTAKVEEILGDIAQQDEQAARVITRLRSFLKDGATRHETLSIDTIVRDALALTHGATAMSGVAVDTEIAPDLPRVRGDAVQLLQVLVNLIVNACDAMRGIPAPERRLRVTAVRTTGESVEIFVVDRGSGLPAGEEERVFEAFFTTKPDGLGLGLPICRSIVAAHGGRLWAENARGRGAAFHLVLPQDPHGG